MSRFKVSKFKNAVPVAAKREFWVHDLNIGSLNSYSNHIKASCHFIAFNHDSNSIGSLAVLPIDSCGRNTSFPTISGHAGFVTDFDFSPFHDRLIATGSEDCTFFGLYEVDKGLHQLHAETKAYVAEMFYNQLSNTGVTPEFVHFVAVSVNQEVKLWDIPADGISGSLSSPTATFGPMEKRIESLLFHPAADNILALCHGLTLEVWDIEQGKAQYKFDGHGNVAQNISWKGNGSLLVSVCKEGNSKKIRVWDPRAGTVAMEVQGHSGLKESQVLWLGEEEYIASSGFGVSRDSQVLLWDTRSFKSPVASESFGTTVGSPMIFYDEDTKMFFTAVKGESTIVFHELTDKPPHLSPGGNMYRSDLQMKGLAMVPKRACYIVGCQVAKFLQLTKNAVVPVGFYTQRKSYNDFHADLFPDTKSGVAAMTAQQWMGGANEKVSTVSLDPAKMHSTAEKKKPQASTGASTTTESSAEGVDTPSLGGSREQAKEMVEEVVEEKEAAPVVNPKLLNIVRTSKFRHIEGSVMHKSTHIDGIPPLCETVPGDSNAFSCTEKYMAVALKQVGGQIAVFELSKVGRLPTSTPTFQNKASVMDFVIDPFNCRRLVVACDDCCIRVWTIPEGGLQDTATEPDYFITGHEDKCNILLFHPMASSLLATAACDGTVLIWDLDKKEVKISLDPLPEPLFAIAWSHDGTQLATVCKDQRIRIYNPRKSTSPTHEGVGSQGSRGARVVWVSHDHIVVSGFSKSTERQLLLFDINDLSKPKGVAMLEVSPSTLVPHFDKDTNVLFLAGKGDRSVYAFEFIPDEAPYLHQVSGFHVTYPHQAVAFLPKRLCDVRKVEIARAIRLCKSSAEPVSFKVPRVRMEFFQDDVFPDTKGTWEPSLTAEEWLGGSDTQQKTISLKPDGMTPLSLAPKPKAAPKKYESYNPKYKTDEEKKEELLSAMIGKMSDKDGPLPQDEMEGVAEEEWDDY